MIGLSAMGVRCKIGTIGFNQNLISRQNSGDLSRLSRIGKGESTRERDVLSELYKLECHFGRA